MRLSIAARTMLIYVAIGVSWIFFSDSFVNLLVGPESSASFQLLKGLFYVGATALAGYLMLSRAINRMEASEARYHDMFASSADALFLLAPDFRIIDANDVACEWYGYSRKQLLQMNFHQIAGCDSCEHSEDCGIAHAAQGRQTEALHCRADNSRFPVEVLATPLEDQGKKHILVNVRDIRARVRAEQELRESEERYRTYVDHAPVGIVIADRLGLIRDVNRTACDLLGYSHEELDRHSITHLYVDESMVTPEAIKRFFEQGSLTVELKMRRKDGSEMDAIINAVTLDKDTVIGFFIDVTEQRRLEQQLQRAARMESVGRLAGGVAHDLNNLLQVIGGHAELLKLEAESVPNIERDLARISDATERAAALVRQLLAFSRKQVISPTHLDVNHVIAEMLKLISRTIGEHIHVKFDPCAETACTYADVSQMEQVIMNLCVNARDAMPDGGELHISTRRVSMDEDAAHVHADARAGEYIVIRVQDSGQGMDDETRSRIFEPFFTTKGFGTGTGLGLATVYGVVVQHGGFITVLSEPGKGASFEVYLPAAQPPVEEAAAPVAPRPAGGTETILLAEDDPGVRVLTRRFLRTAGYTVIEATDGVEAIRMGRENIDKLDMALVDVVMPQAGGREVYDTLKALRPDLPVLFMSGYTSGELDHNSVLLPGMELLSKPFDHPTLLQRVRAVLDEARASVNG